MGRSTFVIGAALLGFSSCTCNQLAGPDAQLKMAGHEMQQLTSIPLGNGLPALSVKRLEVTRMVPEPDLQPPRLDCTVDLDGAIERSPSDAVFAGAPSQVQVSYLGVERIPMKSEGANFVPAGPALPELVAVLNVLEQRNRASGRANDLATLATPDNPELAHLAELAPADKRQGVPIRWLIRVDVADVSVTEERDDGQHHPQRLASTLKKVDGRYLFSQGLVRE
jgi:hypothetical protein